MQIKKLRANPTFDFAAEELKKYLRMMMPERGEIEISLDPEAKDGFRLGLLEDFGLENEAKDPELDDVVHVDAGEDGGILAGSNPRSVLYAVYRFLRLNGCRWFFPGVDGEFIPHKPVTAQKYHHMADLRYRGHTTEGSPSFQHILDYIDLFAKQELNQYGLLGIYSYHRGYYMHGRNSDVRPPEPISAELAAQWKGRYEAELLKRGIMLVDGSHDFVPMSIGVDPADRYAIRTGEKKFPEEKRQYLAMIDGKRDLFYSSYFKAKELFFTNLCMSRADWRANFVKLIADFLDKNRHLGAFTVPLADGHHNHCECPECQKGNPSDFYVMVLNDLDEELTRRGIKTKLRFSTYVDQMFPPLHEKIKNHDRFIITFPPISRSYTSSITKDTVFPKTQPYVRNKWVVPKTIESCGAYLKEWQRTQDFHGDGEIFEYHFWKPQFRDPGLEDFSRRICEDVRGLQYLGLNGSLEDGSNRNYFPHGFHCHIYAETGVNLNLDYEAEAEDYFSNLYGEDWKAVRHYLRGISDAFGEKYMWGEDSVDPDQGQHYNPARAEKLAEVKELAAQARELAQKHLEAPTRPMTVAYRLLRHHADYCEMLAEVFIEKCQGHNRYALELLGKFREEMGRREIELERYYEFNLSVWTFDTIVKKVPVIEF